MRYVREAGSDPSFLLKALGEASGELRREYLGLRRRDLLRAAGSPDEDWCLLAIAYHLRETERGVLGQLQAIVRRREPPILHVDIDDIPFREDYEDLDEDDVLEEFHALRQRFAYSLWDLDAGDWERGGVHPYRGRLTVIDLAREAYRHDLEHLWQVRRMVLALAGSLT
ncbi:MAG: DinB family protein [Tepidiformaceae bacterium]